MLYLIYLFLYTMKWRPKAGKSRLWGGGYGFRFSSTLEIVESPTQWLGAQSLRLYKVRVSCAVCMHVHMDMTFYIKNIDTKYTV